MPGPQSQVSGLQKGPAERGHVKKRQEASTALKIHPLDYPLIQNDYRQEKIIFELFSGALQENPVRAPGAITGGALTGQGPIQETIFGELFSGALQENPVIAPGQLHEKMFTELFW